MAGQAVIGSLRVVLGADTALFENGLKDASGRLQAFSKSMEAMGAVIGGSLAAVGAAFAVSLKGALGEADKMGKMAQTAGQSVEDFSALAYAAKLSDVSVEALGSSMARLSRSMSDAASNATSEAAKAFQALGIHVKNNNGTMKTTTQVVGEVAGKFATYKDGVQKTALAMMIFGRAGASMIPMLNSGADGIAKMTAEARELGIVIDKPTAMAAENFNDNMTKLGVATGALALRVTAQLAPAMAVLSDRLINFVKDSGFAQKGADAIMSAIQWLAEGVGVVVIRLQEMAAQFNALWSMLTAAKNFDLSGIKAGWAAFGAASDEAGKKLQGLGAAFAKFWADVKAGGVAAAKAAGASVDAPGIAAAKNAIDAYVASTQKRIAAMTAEAQAIGRSTFETAKEKIALEAAAIAKANHITVTEALQKKLTDLANAYAAMADRIEGKRVWESTRTAAEQFGRTMEDLSGKLSRGSINWDTYNRAVVQAQQKLVQADPIAQGIGQTLESAFDKAIQGGTKFSDICAQLGRDLLKLMANQAFKMLLMGNGGQQGILGSIMGGLAGAFSGGGGVLAGGKALGQGGIGHNALGTKNWKGGLTWVGERGPEIVDLPRGARVHPNNIAEGMAGGGMNVVNNFTLSGDVSQATIDRLERMSLTNARAIAKTNQSISSASRFQRTGVM
jgi:TP901 family phage tail tape measure protein